MPNKNLNYACDVAIIGAGTIGLTLAHELVIEGLDVVLIERGNKEIEKYDISELFMSGEPYTAAYDGRIIGIGGTSRIWGGALIPFTPADTRDWVQSLEYLTPRIKRIEKLFKVSDMPNLDRVENFDLHDYFLAYAKVPSGYNRNTWNLTRSTLESSPNFRLLTETVVDQIVTRNTSDYLHCSNKLDESVFEVKAKFTIIAAGAIESTKLLARIEPKNNQVGERLSDHLQIKIGTIYPSNWRSFLKKFGLYGDTKGRQMLPRFVFRDHIEIEPNNTKSAHYVSIHYNRDAKGFAELREILEFKQSGSRPTLAVYRNLLNSLVGVSRIFIYLLLFKRIYFSSKLPVDLVLVIEPLESLGKILTNEITEIKYHVADAEIDNVLNSTKRFYSFWEKKLQSEYGIIQDKILSFDATRIRLKSSSYHPVGTTSMATNQIDGAIKSNLSTKDNPRIFVASTSVLPKSGSGNPTLMALALGFSVVDEICEYFKSSR